MEKEPLEVVRLKSLEDLTGGRIADTSSVPTKALPGRLWHPILQKEASRKCWFNLGCFVKICVFLKLGLSVCQKCAARVMKFQEAMFPTILCLLLPELQSVKIYFATLAAAAC